MNEIELKFTIDAPTARQFWKRGQISKLMRGRPTSSVLKSTYLDTPDHVLWAAGIVLRVRRDGRRWVQTVKTKGQIHGGLSQVQEFEAPAPGGKANLEAIADRSLRDHIKKLVNGAPLSAVCETVMKRTQGEVCLEDGTRAMLSLDVGEIRAAQQREELREVEIELLDGRVEGLFEIAHAIFPRGGLTFSKLSKGARGYLLARQGRIDLAIAPRSALAVALDPKQTAEQAARDILRECIDHISSNMAVIEKLDDPEGPHQLRVGLRRLRSAFAVFTPVVGGAEMARLNTEARWLGREVGRLRDLDAIANDVVLKQADAHPDESGLPLLAEALRSEAAGVREQLRAILIDGRTQALLIDLVRFVETRAWIDSSDVGQARRLQAPVAKLARAALARRWVKVGKRARHLANLTAAQRHELRKELKKLRYAVEFFARLFPAKRTERFLRHLKDLQVVFGDLNDVAVMKALFASSHPRFANDPGLQRPIGWVIGASQARAEMQWNATTALWRKLRKSRVFWD